MKERVPPSAYQKKVAKLKAEEEARIEAEEQAREAERARREAANLDYVMLALPPGSFTMGCTPGAMPPQESDLLGKPMKRALCESDEKPAHQVTVSGFEIGVTEVSQGLYQAVIGSNPSKFRDNDAPRYAHRDADYTCWGSESRSPTTTGKVGGDNCPVENVNWFDAVAFANALSLRKGLEQCYVISGKDVSWPKGPACKGYRLPTEAEWEYAARAGEDTLYAGANDLNEVAWHAGNAGGKTHAVSGGAGVYGQKAANAWGLYDMSGNVFEWCWDWYGEDTYQSGSRVDPVGPESGTERVVRGGSYGGWSEFLRIANREKYESAIGQHYVGFRVVRSLP